MSTTFFPVMDQNKIRVLVVDDYDLVRGKLISLLIHEPDIIVVGGACHGREALQKISALEPNVVLMDVRMPIMDGIEATARIVSDYPNVRVLGLSQIDQDEYINRMIKAGARGYVLKSYAAEELRPAIRTVHAGGHYYSAAIAREGTEPDSGEGSEVDDRPAALTPTEQEVLRLLVSRRSSRQIAEILHVDVRSVEFHKANLIEKTGTKDADGLIQYAISHNIVSLDPGANQYEVEHRGR